MIRVVVQHEPIDPAAEFARLACPGAVATFAGQVRADDGVTALELEHYPGMTEATLTALAAEAQARWSLDAVTIVHRVGTMQPGEHIVFVATAAPHRRAALDGCAALIDRLKTDVPFWKREIRGGDASWVERRTADEVAARRWDGVTASG